MSKFKVGDKVKEIGNNEIKEIGLVSSFDDGTIGYVLKFDDSEMYYEEELELYKTPHQELLDLGWELKRKFPNEIQYIKEKTFLDFCLKERTYKFEDNYKYIKVDLKLAKILTRYLEELENE